MSCEIALMSPALRTLPTETPKIVRADDRREIRLDPLGVERVHARNDRDARGREPRQERADGLARVGLLGGRHGVLHVGHERVGFQAERLLEHVGLVAGHEQQAA